MEVLEEFLEKLGVVFPEKSKELKSSLENIKTIIENLESSVKKLKDENQELKNGNALSIKKAIQSGNRDQNETIRNPIYGERGSGPIESPRHIVNKSESDIVQIRLALKNDIVMKKLSKAQMDAVIDAFQEKTIEENTLIIDANAKKKDEMFIIKEGLAAVLKPIGMEMFGSLGGIRQAEKVLKPGDLFGEIAVFYNCARTASRHDFKRVLATIGTASLQEKIEYVSKITHFETFSKLEQKKVAACLSEQFFAEGSQIIRQGDIGHSFYVIKSGSVKVSSNGEYLATLEQFKYFGDISLLSNTNRNADVVAATDVTCYVLNKALFVNLIGSIERHRANSPARERVLSLTIVNDVYNKQIASHFKLAEMVVIKRLGKGGYGTVHLVSTPETKSIHLALKMIPKYTIVKNHQEKYILRERDILSSLHCKFISKLYTTFKDLHFVYFLTDAYLGGSLFDLLVARGPLDEIVGKYYAADITLALEYLHLKNICHRDLKPENLMINHENGHLVLVDFGMAKIVEEKTWTFCGTPEYIAPEIILNNGHDIAVDYWSLGVVIYEMLSCSTPFRDSTAKGIQDRIVSGIDLAPFVFQCSKTGIRREISEAGTSLIKSLCKRSPTSRLGYQSNGIDGIRKHKWFKEIDWNAVLDQRISGPLLG
ncbi:Oidioi.mRNA.OKI2018_I69.chr2.g6071.t1.cds [Oikopleura dioica]|uniref:Oidioi.mRNA.OKI2018_I69.chr2.g6071.t1.cds n=1 Tax=Oikopleura dioica TaxID=34765 RepID=A0ABN7T1W9_OIKDI|nr:Oidioi.mRNA.OKI2018_I69.chr2.g6071.t1.cds [Oikopleura dioica]